MENSTQFSLKIIFKLGYNEFLIKYSPVCYKSVLVTYEEHGHDLGRDQTKDPLVEMLTS
jgi:hypothetical protein